MQVYRIQGNGLVPTCTDLYSSRVWKWSNRIGFLYQDKLVHTRTYQYIQDGTNIFILIPVHTNNRYGMILYILWHTCLYLIQTGVYQYILVHTGSDQHTSIYWYKLVITGTCCYRLVYTGTYWYILIYQCTKKVANKVRTRDLLHTFRMLYHCTASVQTANTILILDFSPKIPLFSPKRNFFLQTE